MPSTAAQRDDSPWIWGDLTFTRATSQAVDAVAVARAARDDQACSAWRCFVPATLHVVSSPSAPSAPSAAVRTRPHRTNAPAA